MTEQGAGAEPVRIRVVQNGPLIVEGPVRMELADGSVVESDRFAVALCRCRRSKLHPFCDTSHRTRRRTDPPAPDPPAPDPPAPDPPAPDRSAQGLK